MQRDDSTGEVHKDWLGALRQTPEMAQAPSCEKFVWTSPSDFNSHVLIATYKHLHIAIVPAHSFIDRIHTILSQQTRIVSRRMSVAVSAI